MVELALGVFAELLLVSGDCADLSNCLAIKVFMMLSDLWLMQSFCYVY